VDFASLRFSDKQRNAACRQKPFGCPRNLFLRLVQQIAQLRQAKAILARIRGAPLFDHRRGQQRRRLHNLNELSPRATVVAPFREVLSGRKADQLHVLGDTE
jgi:hypothetical protein